MIQTYSFHEGSNIQFDDSKSVRELVKYAFDVFGYYEPFGIDIVTIFQPYFSKTSTGWFTTDTSRSCAEEIESPNESLCFAYHMPNVFYFAEGGWGHHMRGLGNHPDIPDAVVIKLCFEDFRESSIVINGNFRIRDIINKLMQVGYLSQNCSKLKVTAVYGNINLHLPLSYTIPFSDPIIDVTLTEFESMIKKYHAQNLPDYDRISFETLTIV